MDNIFAATYSKLLPQKSRDEAFSDLVFMKADDIIKLVQLDAEYHNLKLLVRNEFKVIPNLEELLIPYSKTDVCDLKANVKTIGKDAIIAYERTKNAKDIDLVFDVKLKKEVAKLNLSEEIIKAWESDNNGQSLDNFYSLASMDNFGNLAVYGWWLKCRK